MKWERQPHIKLTKDEVHPVALIFGDPARGDVIAGMCDKATHLMTSREYKSWSCTYNGASFLAISHGVGSPGAAVCIEELINLGVQVIIRAGTCGTLQNEKYKQGDVVIAIAGGKGDGVSKLLEPIEIPAVADFGVVQSLVDASKELGINARLGIAYADDLFYKSKVMPSHLERLRDSNVDIIEMESACLFTLCRHYGIKAGALFAVDGAPLNWAEGNYDPYGEACARGKENMLKMAIRSCSNVAKEYVKEQTPGSASTNENLCNE